jgi:dCMP deaminase
VWDKRLIDMAALVGGWSKDPNTQVGAVISDTRHRVLSVGFNGFPRGIADDARLHNQTVKLAIVIHAEENAILNAHCSLEGAVLHTTHAPCARCAAKIIQVGIVRVVMPPQDDTFLAKWGNDGISLLLEAGVEVGEYVSNVA